MLLLELTDICHSNHMKVAKKPVVTGPVMICAKKNRETYQSLFQKMTNACLELRNTLKAYGSDGSRP